MKSKINISETTYYQTYQDLTYIDDTAGKQEEKEI